MSSLLRTLARCPAAALLALTALPLLAAPAAAGSAPVAPAVPTALPAVAPAPPARLGPAVTTPVSTADVVGILDHLELRNIGPAIMGGRVADIAVVESDTSIVYVGTASGGVWKTVNHGTTWEPVFDDQETASIGDVTVSQQNPNLVWVGSGEPQNRQSSPWGNGVYRSLDGGATWAHMGLDDTRHIARIQIDPRDNDTVFVAAVGHLWGPNEERGVFRTRDGGATWEKVLYVDEDTGAIDLAMDPRDPNTLFAAMYQRRRRGFGFNGGGPGSGIYRTYDGGETWQELTAGLPPGDKGRIGLSIYRRDPNLVMAIVEAGNGLQGVYKSTDRGDTWEHTSTTNNRPMYYSQIRIDPSDPQRIYLGGSDLFASEDGGYNFRDDAAEDVHLDHHALWIDPNDSDHLILGSDGGVSLTFDRTRTWRQLTNLTISQFYEIGVDMREPYYVCGGLQDNGSWCGPSQTWSSLGIRNGDWYNISGGDGFYVRIDPSDHSILFSESQGGNIGRVNLVTHERQRIRPLPREQGQGPESGEEIDDRWNWNTPLLISQHDRETIYAGSERLFKSTDRGTTWEAISPDLSTGVDRDTLEIMGTLVERGETLSAHDGISSYGNMTTISESPLDPQVLYIGTDDGNLQGTRDGGGSWELLNQDVPGLPERTMVSRVVASAHDADRVYATFDGHENDDYRPYVYRSDDGGSSWTPIVDGLPADWSVNVVVEHPRNEDLLFLGNEVGVFFSIDRGETWARVTANLPTVPVDDLVIHPRDNDLVIGTHGRGIWILDDITPLEQLDASIVETDAHLFGSRPAVMYSMYTPQEWSPGIWRAPNPPFGAVLRYWLAEDAPRPRPEGGRAGGRGGGGRGGGRGGFGGRGGPPAPRPEPPEPTVTFTVLDAAGNQIRQFEGPGRAGLQQAVWDLRMDPAREGGGGGGFRGGGGRGPRVVPGAYTIRLDAAGGSQQTAVEVRMDPRIEITQADLEARQAAIMDAYELAGPAIDARQAGQAMAQRLQEIQDVLDGAADAPGDLVTRASELMQEVEDLDDRMDVLQGALGAMNAIESFTALPTADQLWQIESGWQEAPGVIGDLNDLVGRVNALTTDVFQAGVAPEPVETVEVPARSR